MIKLTRPKCPEELTEEVKQRLTAEFAGTGGRVWNQPYIRHSLWLMSKGKCAYCEMKLREEGKHLHVEHFHHKSKYLELVVEWTNLLPSCARCNTKKGPHDVAVAPIVDPSVEDPHDHLYLENYRFKPKTPMGTETIGTLDLNNFHELMVPRFEIGNQVQENLEDLLEKTIEYRGGAIEQLAERMAFVAP